MSDPVSAVGDREDDLLLWRGELGQHVYRFEIDAVGSDPVAVAQRGSDQRRERNDDVGVAQQVCHDPFVPAIPAHDPECLVGAAIQQAVLPEQKAVEDGDAVSPFEQLFAQHRSDIPRSTGHKHMCVTHGHGKATP